MSLLPRRDPGANTFLIARTASVTSTAATPMRATTGSGEAAPDRSGPTPADPRWAAIRRSASLSASGEQPSLL